MRIVIGIITLLIALGLAIGTVWSFAAGTPLLLSITCGLLAVGFGFFVYHDYQYFFGKKAE